MCTITKRNHQRRGPCSCHSRCGGCLCVVLDCIASLYCLPCLHYSGCSTGSTHSSVQFAFLCGFVKMFVLLQSLLYLLVFVVLLFMLSHISVIHCFRFVFVLTLSHPCFVAMLPFRVSHIYSDFTSRVCMLHTHLFLLFSCQDPHELKTCHFVCFLSQSILDAMPDESRVSQCVRSQLLREHVTVSPHLAGHVRTIMERLNKKAIDANDKPSILRPDPVTYPALEECKKVRRQAHRH